MMKQTGQIFLLAALSGSLLTPALLAQSAPSDQSQPAPQTQPSQPSQNQYSGVSQPPPDSSIQADDDLPPPAPAPPPTPKPSAAVPATPAPAPAAPAPVVAPAAPVAPPSSNGAFAGEVDNTDDGIVTVVPGAAPQAALEQRPSAAPADQDTGMLSSVPYDPSALQPGTNVYVRLSQDLTTAETQPGTPFTATVSRNVYNGDRLVIPFGSQLHGRVTSISQGHHLGPHAEMHLRPESVTLPDGSTYRLYADVIQSNAPGTRADDEGGIVATPHYKKDAVEYGAGVGTGAIVGGVVAGPVGAGVGTLIGAGAVTTHMLLQHPEAANLPQGTTLVFSLTQPMPLTTAKN
jgi:hypothetical protein